MKMADNGVELCGGQLYVKGASAVYLGADRVTSGRNTNTTKVMNEEWPQPP